MARYSQKGLDTIRYDITTDIAIRYDLIRKCFTLCKNRMLSVTNYSYIRTHIQQQAGNSAQHWSTVVLPINTVAATGAWILVDW